MEGFSFDLELIGPEDKLDVVLRLLMPDASIRSLTRNWRLELLDATQSLTKHHPSSRDTPR